MVPKPIRHNPGVSQTLIISSLGFCEYPWLSRSEGGPFTLSAREELTPSTRILGATDTVPKLIKHNPGVSLLLIISCHGFCDCLWLTR